MERSYLMTMTALIIHQIDAAYWKGCSLLTIYYQVCADLLIHQEASF